MVNCYDIAIHSIDIVSFSKFIYVSLLLGVKSQMNECLFEIMANCYMTQCMVLIVYCCCFFKSMYVL